jgi:hypothetical protein
MKRLGTPFAGFINESLSSYLTNNRDRSVLRERQEKFLVKLEEAITDGKPLVDINQGLLRLIHNSRPTTDYVISTIPLDATSDIFTKVGEILQRKGLAGAVGGKTFDPQSTNQSIDFFSVHMPVQPMVLDSIIRPISQYWNSHNSSASTRAGLMLHRRPRYLYESIPAGEIPKQDIFKGYFIARALKQFLSDRDLTKLERKNKGPKLSVWSGDGSKYYSFPYPLLSTDEVEVMDFPGGIIFSLSIAIVACNGSQSLEPLEAYKRLQELADVKSSSSAVKHWLESGDTSDGPTPDPERAGRKEDTAEVRKDTLVKYISDTIAKYEARFASQSLATERDGSLGKDMTWELREPLLEALRSLQRDIQKLSFEQGESED